MTNIELDPRVVRTRELVLAAAGELLVEQGFERVTIEANAEWGRALPSMIGAAAFDEELSVAYGAFSDRRRAIVGQVFLRAADRGEIVGPFPPEVLAETFASGFFFHHLMARLPLDETYIAQQVNLVTMLAGAD